MSNSSNPDLRTVEFRGQITNLQIFVAFVTGFLGVLSGTVVGFAIYRKIYLVIALGIVLASLSILTRSEWRRWKPFIDPILPISSFAIGFGFTMVIFALTREII